MFVHACRNRVFNREEGFMYIRAGTKGTDLVGHVSRTLIESRCIISTHKIRSYKSETQLTN